MQRIHCISAPAGYVVATIDAKDLYPSLDQKDVVNIVSKAVKDTRFSTVAADLGIDKNVLPIVVHGLLLAVLSAQVVEFNQQL